MTALKTVQQFFPKVKRVADATRNAVIEVTKQLCRLIVAAALSPGGTS